MPPESSSWLEVLRETPWVAVGSLAHLLLFIAVLLHIFRHQRRTDSTLLWILIVWAIPFGGAVLYAVFGVDRIPSSHWRRAKTRRERMRWHRLPDDAQDDIVPEIYWKRVLSTPAIPQDPEVVALDAPFTTMSQTFPLLDGNEVRPLLTGDEAFPEMLAAIRAAKDHIHLQSFIIGNDSVGREFVDALIERANAGVRVRMMYDRFGSSYAIWGGLLNRMRHVPNLTVAGWSQFNIFRLQLHFNLRNHRKVLVVDGRKAFTGGINLSISQKTTPGAPAIQDYHFAVCGPVVQELQYSFLRDWHVMTEENPADFLTARYFPKPETCGGNLARILNAGPSSELRVAVDVFFSAISQARRSVLIITPYFLPTEDLCRALRHAAMRGVRVQVIVPERSNHWYTTWAGRALYEDLLESGVRIFERRPPFIHAKAMVVDEQLAVVGSANWDVRSLYSNYETLMTVYGQPFLTNLRILMTHELGHSQEVHLQNFKNRPMHERYFENICSLFAPLL